VTIPALIARRVGARIWIGRCVRLGNQSRFKIEFHELKVPRTANAADDVKAITAAMQAQFEVWVREMPEQWMWSNRRWS
jgi:KDO2-lipid IV(A) lauroyltransferase